MAMLTNQKVLGLILILFIISAMGYFTVSKFKKEVSDATVSSMPTPTPSNLTFIFNTPAPFPEQNNQPAEQAKQPKPTATELPLTHNKRVGQFPGILKPEVLQNSAGGPGKAAVIKTNKGEVAIEIFPDVPQTASNFLLLAANGFYDGLKFHRVEDWVIQGGDPLGNGTGGPGYTFADEPVTREYKKGIVAMANAGPNTNGSQFFILKQDYPLAPNYTIFGAVIAGQDIVDKISVGDVMQKVTIQNLQ